MEPLSQRHSVIVGIATTGRRALVSALVSRIEKQTLRPAFILLAPAKPDDVDASLASEHVRIVHGRPGACAQRNTIIDEAIAIGGEVLVFFDDDFVPCNDYLERISDVLMGSGVVFASGHILADGATGPGIAIEDADNIITTTSFNRTDSYPAKGVYGCNMAMRIDALKERGTRFDENLPAYSLFEDALFSLQFCAPGECHLAYAARGVHLGTKMGRTPGVRMGYSQIANPFYIWRTVNGVPFLWAVRLATRALLANCAKSVRPEPYIDRRGRLRGNLLALGDTLLCRIHPTRIDSL